MAKKKEVLVLDLTGTTEVVTEQLGKLYAVGWRLVYMSATSDSDVDRVYLHRIKPKKTAEQKVDFNNYILPRKPEDEASRPPHASKRARRQLAAESGVVA